MKAKKSKTSSRMTTCCRSLFTSQEFAQSKSAAYKHLFRDIYGNSKPTKVIGLGPKHVFQKLPQVSFKEEEDFDDMRDIEDILTQRKLISAQDPKQTGNPPPKLVEEPKATKKESSKPAPKDQPKPANKPEVRTEQKVFAPQKPPEKAKPTGNQMIKMEELKKHNTAADAWTAIHGVVYDVTDFIKRHPGGQGAILKILGQDGTRLFGTLPSSRQGPQNC